MISVIIPTYNRAATIGRSVQSVLGQTYTDLECIVVDDGSSDETRTILSDINDVRLRYVRLEQHTGAGAARNKGIDLARGEYIAFQDSDDVWAKNKLERQMRALQHAEADVCFCRKRKFDISQKNQDTIDMDLSGGFIPYEILYKSSRVSTQTILAHKYVFDEEKFDQNLKKAQDYEWCLRAGEKFTFFFVAETLVDQYMQRDSITVRGEKNYRIEENVSKYIYDKFQDKYHLNPGLEAALLKRYACFKTMAGGNTSKEFRRVYQLSGRTVDFLEFLAGKTAPGILKQWFLFQRRKYRKTAS